MAVESVSRETIRAAIETHLKNIDNGTGFGTYTEARIVEVLRGLLGE
jgi:hypothetical protein